MTAYLCCGTFALYLTAAVPAPVAVDAAENESFTRQAAKDLVSVYKKSSPFSRAGTAQREVAQNEASETGNAEFTRAKRSESAGGVFQGKPPLAGVAPLNPLLEKEGRIRKAGNPAAGHEELQVNKTVAVVEEKNLEMDISGKSFRFMLNNIALSAMLASELGISESTVIRQDDGYLITDPWFMFWLDSSDARGKEYSYTFRYSAGLHGLVPIKTAGKGTAKVAIKSTENEKVSFAVTMRMEPYDAPLDKIAQKIPFIIKTLFLLKLEQALRQAEELAGELTDNPEDIIEIIDYEYGDFTAAEKKAVKKFLGKKAKS